jgi:hypothetical protein
MLWGLRLPLWDRELSPHLGFRMSEIPFSDVYETLILCQTFGISGSRDSPIRAKSRWEGPVCRGIAPFAPLTSSYVSISCLFDGNFSLGPQGHKMATAKKGFSAVTYFRKKSNRCKIYTAFILVDVLIVIALVSFGITRALKKSTNVSVIVPLYIYPNEGAWDPLYNAYKS